MSVEGLLLSGTGFSLSLCQLGKDAANCHVLRYLQPATSIGLVDHPNGYRGYLFKAAQAKVCATSEMLGS